MVIDMRTPGGGAVLEAELVTLAAEASEILGRRIQPPGTDSTDAAKRVLARLWDEAVATLSDTTNRADIQRTTALLARIRAFEARLAAADAAGSATHLRMAAQAIARLHGARGVDDLLSRAAEAMGAMGFDRALVSTTSGQRWHLHTMFVVDDKPWADAILAAGRESSPTLDGNLVESDIVQRARPGLVFDVQHNPRVVRPLVEMTKCSSYAVAPLTMNGAVVGLVHGDYYFQRREADATARAMLAVFAAGLGHALAGASLLDGVTALRGGFDRLTGSATASPGYLEGPALSARELEVVELLAAGRANRQIARDLAISEATVKTHITHILRKLGAANRAEAVAYWLRGSVAP
ncbi:LuxR C-terminal-related transcriptional regulator [Nocardia sp. CC227C]|uniref:helix-turn-helix transcriptional regulator n=1 Tax=Nocardia sp. CC227C TaxID=3044562 RepID=UPI00278C0C31|nr:LuxR C-terminal-related transcriptional regulator [Nocardia sp. CC227C]